MGIDDLSRFMDGMHMLRLRSVQRTEISSPISMAEL